MKYNNLGNSDLTVSDICLGTMTWGSQNTEAEGHAQMDYAIQHGVNFFDVAEMYPAIPISAETQGRTEEFIGNWFQATSKRSEVILASKVTGQGIDWVQDGIPISPKKIRTGIEGSLKRLKTDYIDLYQLHWPNRGSYHFRQSWKFDPTGQNREETLEQIFQNLEALDRLIKDGKIRYIGLSNESCWGTSQYLQIAKENNLPRIITIQNEYNLLYRNYDLDLAELSHNENISLLPFSPIACGMLSGKYQGGKIPTGSRMTVNPDLNGRITENSIAATDAYVAIAKKHKLDPAQMALAFCNQRPFVGSSITGATSLEQLANNIAASELSLSEEILDEIHQVYRQYPMPF